MLLWQCRFRDHFNAKWSHKDTFDVLSIILMLGGHTRFQNSANDGKMILARERCQRQPFLNVSTVRRIGSLPERLTSLAPSVLLAFGVRWHRQQIDASTAILMVPIVPTVIWAHPPTHSPTLCISPAKGLGNRQMPTLASWADGWVPASQCQQCWRRWWCQQPFWCPRHTPPLPWTLAPKDKLRLGAVGRQQCRCRQRHRWIGVGIAMLTLSTALMAVPTLSLCPWVPISSRQDRWHLNSSQLHPPPNPLLAPYSVHDTDRLLVMPKQLPMLTAILSHSICSVWCPGKHLLKLETLTADPEMSQ